MVAGGAIIGFFYNVRLQHPTQRKPLIDYNVALVLEPMLLLGISVGVVLNIVFPSWLITSALAALLLCKLPGRLLTSSVLWIVSDSWWTGRHYSPHHVKGNESLESRVSQGQGERPFHFSWVA